MYIGKELVMDPLGMQSQNLSIRDSEFEDCALFVGWEQKPYIVKAFMISTDRSYEEIVREYISRSIEEDKRQFTIVLRETGRPIGRVYISKIDRENDSVDMTRIYIGEEDCLGKGYGEEAMHLLLNYFFTKLHMERATLNHLPNNEVATKLYQKVGFQNEGILRNAGKINGRYINLHLMSMLRSEYFGKYHQCV
ncbi:MAG: GNAT family N-acetyltransferase [Anaerovoracaceae bacterium]|jgi:ribosomal-protein-alanine N-acetyltransferase